MSNEASHIETETSLQLGWGTRQGSTHKSRPGCFGAAQTGLFPPKFALIPLDHDVPAQHPGEILGDSTVSPSYAALQCHETS